MVTKRQQYREALRVLVLQSLWKKYHPKNSAVVILSEPESFHGIVNLEWALAVLGADPKLKPTYPEPRHVWMRHAMNPGENDSPFQDDLTIWEGWVSKRKLQSLKTVGDLSYWHRDTPKFPDPRWESRMEDAYEKWMTLLQH